MHRDIKPENLLVTDEARVKIADFGIAKATDEAPDRRRSLTATGTTIGTPAYMAPEQAMGEDVGPRTDLYAVGCIAFELLAGRPPFDDDRRRRWRSCCATSTSRRRRSTPCARRRPGLSRLDRAPAGQGPARADRSRAATAWDGSRRS